MLGLKILFMGTDAGATGPTNKGYLFLDQALKYLYGFDLTNGFLI